MHRNTVTLESKLGYTFKDKGLLSLALTHASLDGKNNQRLEFLGDAVLELVISKMIYEINPPMSEGDMTRMRAKIVCEDGLFEVSKKISLGRFIKMQKSFEQKGGRQVKSVSSDALEAVLGAVFLDGGIETAERTIRSLFSDSIKKSGKQKDYKTVLQEKLQSMGFALPVYKLIKEDGPDHAPTFTCGVHFADGGFAEGTSGSIKQAEQEAAKRAIQSLYVKESLNETKEP
ncbi:MAG: ribonuclease III [Eubacteriales bacterium]|nr:ribonuclease III [Eubacteriales bacterium]